VVHAIQQPDDRTREMFRRYLSGWAMDLMDLRRRGLDRPCRRPGSDSAVCPGPSAGIEQPVYRERALARTGSTRRPRH
jgi:hypothetical protein